MSSNDQFFIGVEAEGRFKGLRTLFVPGFGGMRSISTIYDLSQKHGCPHIYFGASSVYCQFSKEPKDKIADLLTLIKKDWLLFTVETTPHYVGQIPTSFTIYGNFRVMMTIDIPQASELSHPNFEVKVQDRLTANIYTHPRTVDLSYVRDQPIDL